MNSSKHNKQILEMVFFLSVTVIALYTVFHGQDLGQIYQAIRKLDFTYLLAAILTAVFFVSAEGIMIFYLLRSLNGKSGILRCISYSFIGFFYSGITPSATGGQPMQLYYMKKDGNSLADSSVVLMVVALIYKMVLVIFGIYILIFWNSRLRFYLQGYFGLYLLGLMLNIVLVILLIAVMLLPDKMIKILSGIEKLLEKARVLKTSEERTARIYQFVSSYQSAVTFLKCHKIKIIVVMGLTFLQRFSVFVLTYIIYRGFGLQGTNMVTVVLLQASIYIAVDMLPIPGAQGITELMYEYVYKLIFPDVYLMSSLYVTRGINFYFLLICSLLMVIINWLRQLHQKHLTF